MGSSPGSWSQVRPGSFLQGHPLCPPGELEFGSICRVLMWFMLQGTRKLSLGRCCGAGITVRKLIPILRKGNQGSAEAVCPALHQGEQGQFPQVLQALCCSEKQPDIRDADGPTSPRREGLWPRCSRCWG